MEENNNINIEEEIVTEGKKKNYFKEFFPYLMIILVVVFIKVFIVSPIRVNGISMDDTLKNGDIMLLDEVSYRFSDIKRFDIVVVHMDDEYLIKRVMGLPGEEIYYENQKLYINGKYIEEDFFQHETDDFDAIQLGEDEYFVMGDNRMNSTDSRVFGPVTRDMIAGKASLTLFPFSRFGFKE